MSLLVAPSVVVMVLREGSSAPNHRSVVVLQKAGAYQAGGDVRLVLGSRSSQTRAGEEGCALPHGMEMS